MRQRPYTGETVRLFKPSTWGRRLRLVFYLVLTIIGLGAGVLGIVIQAPGYGALYAAAGLWYGYKTLQVLNGS